MSLKVVHVVFVLLATALSVGFGLWGFRGDRVSGNPLLLGLAVGSWVLAAGLVVYLFWFLAKWKHLGR